MLIPSGFAQVNLIYTGSSLPTGAQVTFGIALENPTPDTPVTAATAVNAAYVEAGWLSQTPNTVIHSATLVKFGPNATGPSAQIGGTGVGTNTGLPTPPNTTILVQKLTSMGGRSGRGRSFLPWGIEAQVDGGGNLLAGYRNTLQTVATDFIEALATRQIPMTLLHADASGPISDPLEVIAVSVSGQVATQRRRLRR